MRYDENLCNAWESSGTRRAVQWLLCFEGADAEVIYKFLEVNDIGKTHALYYIAYALHMEFKGKVK